MNNTELQKKMKMYDPALALDQVMSRDTRYSLKMYFFYGTIILSLYVLLSFFHIAPYIQILDGVLSLSIGIFLFLFCIDTFYYDLYFNDLPLLIEEPHYNNPDVNGTFIVAKIVEATGNQDVASGFLLSNHGKNIAHRLDIPFDDITTFVSNKKNKILLSEFEMEITNEDNFFESYVVSLQKKDKEFHDFLFRYSIKEKELVGTTEWVTKKYENEKRELRWWGRDNFRKIESIGMDWSYGRAFILEKYAGRIENLYDFSSTGLGKHTKEIDEMETILSRGNEENIILVSGDELQKIDKSAGI